MPRRCPSIVASRCNASLLGARTGTSWIGGFGDPPPLGEGSIAIVPRGGPNSKSQGMVAGNRQTWQNRRGEANLAEFPPMRSLSMTMTVDLPKSSPEAQGIRSSAILAFLDAVQRDDRELHSLMLLRRGTVVAEGYWEPYRAASPHMLFSLSKSFTSTAIGMLVAEGRLSVDDLVLDYFPDEAPKSPSANLRAMRVRHLLTMTTGHSSEPNRQNFAPGLTWAGGFLVHPVEHEPGTHFVYNSAATYMLSAIAQRITGERLIHYLQSRLFVPLGIENPTWETSPEGIDTGGWGLSIRTADIARFGQLYLQGGVWQ